MKSNWSSVVAARANVCPCKATSQTGPGSCQVRGRASQEHRAFSRWAQAQRGCWGHHLLPGFGTFQPQLLHGGHCPQADAFGVAAAHQPVAPTHQHTWEPTGERRAPVNPHRSRPSPTPDSQATDSLGQGSRGLLQPNTQRFYRLEVNQEPQDPEETQVTDLLPPQASCIQDSKLVF